MNRFLAIGLFSILSISCLSCEGISSDIDKLMNVNEEAFNNRNLLVRSGGNEEIRDKLYDNIDDIIKLSSHIKDTHKNEIIKEEYLIMEKSISVHKLLKESTEKKYGGK